MTVPKCSCPSISSPIHQVPIQPTLLQTAQPHFSTRHRLLFSPRFSHRIASRSRSSVFQIYIAPAATAAASSSSRVASSILCPSRTTVCFIMDNGHVASYVNSLPLYHVPIILKNYSGSTSPRDLTATADDGGAAGGSRGQQQQQHGHIKRIRAQSRLRYVIRIPQVMVSDVLYRYIRHIYNNTKVQFIHGIHGIHGIAGIYSINGIQEIYHIFKVFMAFMTLWVIGYS